MSVESVTENVPTAVEGGPAFSIREISKNFGQHAALTSLSLDVKYGEFVGLLGPNGAGKSTLIKILDGVHSATSGEIRLEGEAVSSMSGHPAVGFVHQDLGLIDELSIVENLRLGERPLHKFRLFLDLKAEAEAARVALAEVDLDLPVTRLVGDLSPAEKALVAVARVFARGARIMFVDEVTSTLPPSDARRVTHALARSAERGAAIVMVTHKLAEVLDVTQRIVMLIDGRLAVDRSTTSLDHGALTELLMNHESKHEDDTEPLDVAGIDGRIGTATSEGDILLELSEACSGILGPINLRLRAGDVLGVGGLPGSGLHDLAFVVRGSLRLESGSVTLAPGASTALVPPHRETQGGFDDHTLEENLAVSSLSRWRSRVGLLSLPRQRAASAEMAERLNVDPPDLAHVFGALSGGNKQKVIFGRALLSEANVYILCEPTRGVDVGTRLEIYSLIRGLQAAGAAVLILSSDAEDLLTTCDRVSVLYDGTLTEPRRVKDFSISELEALL